jgi:hypothetical protein
LVSGALHCLQAVLSAGKLEESILARRHADPQGSMEQYLGRLDRALRCRYNSAETDKLWFETFDSLLVVNIALFAAVHLFGLDKSKMKYAYESIVSVFNLRFKRYDPLAAILQGASETGATENKRSSSDDLTRLCIILSFTAGSTVDTTKDLLTALFLDKHSDDAPHVSDGTQLTDDMHGTASNQLTVDLFASRSHSGNENASSPSHQVQLAPQTGFVRWRGAHDVQPIGDALLSAWVGLNKDRLPTKAEMNALCILTKMSEAEIANRFWGTCRTAIDWADSPDFYSQSSQSDLQDNLSHRIKHPLIWPDESPGTVKVDQRRGNVCSNCSKRFSRKADLKRHLHAHDPSWYYECVVESCRRAFFRKDKLRLHVRNVHGFDPSSEMLRASKHPTAKRKHETPLRM